MHVWLFVVLPKFAPLKQHLVRGAHIEFISAKAAEKISVGDLAAVSCSGVVRRIGFVRAIRPATCKERSELKGCGANEMWDTAVEIGCLANGKEGMFQTTMKQRVDGSEHAAAGSDIAVTSYMGKCLKGLVPRVFEARRVKGNSALGVQPDVIFDLCEGWAEGGGEFCGNEPPKKRKR